MTHDSSSMYQGFRSVDEKKLYKRKVLVVFALFFLFSLSVSIVSTSLYDHVMGPEDKTVVYYDNAVIWNEKIWVPMVFKDEGWQLISLNLKNLDDFDMLPIHDHRNPRLLGSKQGLWVISNYNASLLNDGNIEHFLTDFNIVNCSYPFLYRNLPAMIKDSVPFSCLRVFQNGQWEKEFAFKLRPKECKNSDIDDLKILYGSEYIYLFLNCSGSYCSCCTYYRKGVPAENESGLDSWTLLEELPYHFRFCQVNHTPLVLGFEKEKDSVVIRGYHISENTLVPYMSADVERVFLFRPLAGSASGDIYLLHQQRWSELRISTLRDGRISDEVIHGFSTVSDWVRFSMISIPLAVVVAGFISLIIFVSGMIQMYRKMDISYGERTMFYSSLLKRAIAKAVDQALYLIPWLMAFGAIHLVLIDRILGDWGFLYVFVFLILWFLIWFAVISYCEGKWGVTPGKYCVGIRVFNMNLSP